MKLARLEFFVSPTDVDGDFQIVNRVSGQRSDGSFIHKRCELYLDGYEKVRAALANLPEDSSKLDIQNIIYRYMADAARHTKRIRDSIRSAEAELLACVDDGEDVADGRAFYAEFKDAVIGYTKFTADRRAWLQSSIPHYWEGRALLDSRADRGQDGCQATDATVLSTASGFMSSVTTLMVSGSLWYTIAVGIAFGLVTKVGLLVYKAARGNNEAESLECFQKTWEEFASQEDQLVKAVELTVTGLGSHSTCHQVLKDVSEIRVTMDMFLNALQSKGLLFNAPIMVGR